jgi:alkylation response protein AidB-like acyl-CoA dehydrogenase
MRRVVVTGMGIVSSIGNNAEEVLTSLREARSGVVFAEEYAKLGFRSQVHGAPTCNAAEIVDRRAMRFHGGGTAWAHVAMEQAIAITADYLRTRKQFGVVIGSFQSLQHRIADMNAELELARSMLFVALAAVENDSAELARTLSGAKALITGAARSVCGQAIQLHGGIGMTEELAVGHYFKRAVVADALFGGKTLHERACAASLQRELAGTAA